MRIECLSWLSALPLSLCVNVKLEGTSAEFSTFSPFDRKRSRHAGQPVFSAESVGKSQKRARNVEKKDVFVGSTQSLHTWLMTQRSEPQQHARNGERGEGRGTRWLPYTSTYFRRRVKWWRKQTKRKTNGLTLWNFSFTYTHLLRMREVALQR